MNDSDTWKKYPNLRWTFNKLELSLRLGYICSPSGIIPPYNGEYCIRPIYNLGGMGAGAKIQYLSNNKIPDIPAGYFWCEKFSGPHISVDYSKENEQWKPVFSCQGYRDKNNPLYKFDRWKKIKNPNYELPQFIKDIDADKLNIEFIGDKIIEIHLRHGSDFPKNSTEIIPLWSDMEKEKVQSTLTEDWTYIENIDDSDGNLSIKRLGFFAKIKQP